MKQSIAFGLFAIMSLLARQAPADPLGIIRLIDGGPARIDFSFRSDVWTSPNQNKVSPLRIHHLKVNTPVVQNDEWKLNLMASFENLRVGNAGLSVGEDQIEIAGDLRSEAMGASFEKKHGNESISSFFASYSSDSDEPFQDRRDRALDYSFYHKFAPQGSWRWVAGFDRTKNRGIYNDRIIPLLGVIYKPRPEFTAVFGFFFLRFAWNEEIWQKQITLTPVGSEFQLSHKLDDFITFYTRFGISNRAYMNTQRLNDDMRIIFEEKYIELAAARMLSDMTSLETDIGYSFNRRIYEGKQVMSSRGEVVGLRPDLYAALKARFQF